MGSSEDTISNLSISTVAEIREKYTVFAGVRDLIYAFASHYWNKYKSQAGVIIGAVSLIFILGIVVCHFAWKSTKEKDDNESGW